MALTSGTATSHYDLLVKLKNFVAANGWTVLRFVDDAGVTSFGRGSVLNLQGPGNSTLQPVFVNISTVNNNITPSYGWQVSCSLNFNSALGWGFQPLESPQPYLNLWENNINYWFFVSNRRIIVIAQVSTLFMSMHAGMFLPWGNPQQYPAPLLVCGDFYKPVNWSVTDTGRRMMVDCGGGPIPGGGPTPVLGAGWTRDPNGTWVSVQNEVLTGSANDQSLGIQNPGLFSQIWPWASGGGGGNTDPRYGWGPYYAGQARGGALDAFVPTAQGERFVWPTQILYGAGAPLGTIEGVYATFGAGLSSAATVTVGSRNFLAFQNIARTSGNDFFLVEEV